MRMCLAANMDGFLSKPSGEKEFEAVLERWLPRTPEIKLADSTPSACLIDINTSMPTREAASLDEEIVSTLRTRHPALLVRLIKVYLDFVPSTLTVMRSAIENGQAQSLGAAVHSLKSGSANMCRQDF